MRRLDPAVAAARIEAGLTVGVAAAGEIVAQRAQAMAPVDTGRLARSIRRTEPTTRGPMRVSCLVGTNVEYAAAQEFGSGLRAEDESARHVIIIEPRYAKALAFRWPDGPKDNPAYDHRSGLFFFRRVRHPGVPPHPYLRPALASVRSEAAVTIMEAVAAALRRG